MFTQQHYKALQKILADTRRSITASLPQMQIAKGRDEAQAALAEQMFAISEFQLKLQSFLKKDNPKFKELLFIGGASEHSPPQC